MMKYKKSQEIHKNHHSLWNMTWDLYIMSQFFRMWTDKKEKQEFLFASDDNAFCELLRSTIEVQKQENFLPLKPYLTDSAYEEAQKYHEMNLSTVERAYQSDDWGTQYRKEFISKYENKLLSK